MEYYETGMQAAPNDGLMTSGTMTTEELRALQGENGEYYRGMQAAPNDGLMTSGTMTTEELHALQGENGEYYRGMQVAPNDVLMTSGTMTTKELHALQGENGEYYRSGYVADENEYRKETTGATTEELAQIVIELSQLNFVNSNVVSEKLSMLKNNSQSIQKILEYRMTKTFDALFGYGEYNKDSIKCDMMILNELVNNQYNINDIKVNVGTLVGEEDILNVNQLLDRYKNGLMEKRNYGYDVSLNDNNDLIEVVENIKDIYNQKNNIEYEYQEENIRKM